MPDRVDYPSEEYELLARREAVALQIAELQATCVTDIAFEGRRLRAMVMRLVDTAAPQYESEQDQISLMLVGELFHRMIERIIPFDTDMAGIFADGLDEMDRRDNVGVETATVTDSFVLLDLIGAKAEAMTFTPDGGLSAVSEREYLTDGASFDGFFDHASLFEMNDRRRRAELN